MKLLIAVSLVASSLGAWAQVTNAKVTFNEQVKFKIDLEGEAAQFANLLPKEQKSQYELHFTQDKSFYRTLSKSVEEQSSVDPDGGQMQIKINRPQVSAFLDLTAKKRIEQKEFLTRKFIVESELASADWKITTNQKMILGYPCQEAIKQDSAKSVHVWFTPAIPVSTGPAGFEGLPGLVLAVEAMDGDYKIEAATIETGKADQSLMIKPTEGKKMSKEAYEKMVKEKQAEMGVTGGNGKPNVMIRVENR
ncbi:MAG TPA: GLPGLI family protein [Luteibaculaceae bacterium]|nr:GLPGLI family protein [Luteibaculaceae bacterium]